MTRGRTNEAGRGSGELGRIVGVNNPIGDDTKEALLEALHEPLLALLPKPPVNLLQ